MRKGEVQLLGTGDKRPLMARSRLTAFVSARRKAVVQDQFINQEMTGRFGRIAEIPLKVSLVDLEPIAASFQNPLEYKKAARDPRAAF